MKKVVITQAFGDKWMDILKMTRPRMEAYCQRHGQDFISIEKPLADISQYTKLVIPNIITTRGYNMATFLDCDVLIAQDCEDLTLQGDECDFLAFDEGEYLDRKKGMAELAKAFGVQIEPKFYFNTGVFVANNKCAGAFSQPPIGLFPNHFAEQTWLNMMLHLWDVKTSTLDPAFNCMTSVESHFGLDRYKDASIIHYAGQSANLDKLVKTIAEDDAKWKEIGR